jgi:hypothetical protein
VIVTADYLCPTHGHFEASVETPTPDDHPCPVEIDCDHRGDGHACICGTSSPWSPTQFNGKVKRVEVVRGGWQKPERKTWLDTRELGEGQDPEEFRAKRREIRDEERKKAVMEMLRE